MVKQWRCSGSCDPSVASRPLSFQRQWLVLLPPMAASCTWWALPTSVTAAKRMWPRWAAENLQQQDFYSLLFHLHLFKTVIRCELSVKQWSNTVNVEKCCRVAPWNDDCSCPNFLSHCSFALCLSCTLLCSLAVSYLTYPRLSLSLLHKDDSRCAARRCGGGAVPVQGVYAEDGREYTVEGSQRHQPG